MNQKELKKLMKLEYPISYIRGKGYYYVWHEDLPGCRADGITLEEAEANLADVREDWIKLALERGMVIPKPGELSRYSGKLLVRLPLDMHRKLVLAARANKTSINTYAISLLSRALTSFGTIEKIEERQNFADLLESSKAGILTKASDADSTMAQIADFGFLKKAA